MEVSILTDHIEDKVYVFSIQNLPELVRTFKLAAAWIFPAGLTAKHWNIPESLDISPIIFKLFLK